MAPTTSQWSTFFIAQRNPMTHFLRDALSLVLLGLASSSAAIAGDKYVLTTTPSKVMRFDGTNGALLDPNFCDIDGLLGLGGAFHDMREGVFLRNGELLVANATLRAIHRFSADGSTYVSDLPTTGQPPTWMAVANDRLWVIEGTTRLAQYDLATNLLVGLTQLVGGNANDVHPYNGELLVTGAFGSDIPIRRVDPATGNITGSFATPPGINCQMLRLASGNLLVARLTSYIPALSPGYYEFTPAGSLVAAANLSLAQPEGIAELSSGRYIVATQQGIWSWDPVTLTSVMLHGATAYGVFDGPANRGTNYCTANPNSTGQSGVITGHGSVSVAANNLTISASLLPLNSFGYFITSLTQTVTPNPGGSQGVLCLGGLIGRYTGPGQIKNTGATGSYLLLLDLAQIPTSTGFEPAVVGQSRNFQSWHRDSVGGAATSNFTNALSVTFL
jgi:hypothetical protein